ncbi:MAG: hypothetical protein ACI97B_004927 [Verrucomicrobiales bacterium]|jgi:hypothetical protein
MSVLKDKIGVDMAKDAGRFAPQSTRCDMEFIPSQLPRSNTE